MSTLALISRRGRRKFFTQMLSKRLRKVKLADKAIKRLPKKTKQTNALKNVVRTPGTIIRTLQTVNNRKDHLAPYVVCRTNPFHGHGGSAIPDGKNSNLLLLTPLVSTTLVHPPPDRPSLFRPSMPYRP